MKKRGGELTSIVDVNIFMVRNVVQKKNINFFLSGEKKHFDELEITKQKYFHLAKKGPPSKKKTQNKKNK